jgi:hypothetical protein
VHPAAVKRLMAEKFKDSCSFPTSSTDETVEHHVPHGKRKALSARFEVGVATAVRSTSATRDAAIRRARTLARAEKVEAIVYDRMAKPGAQSVWLFNDEGLIRAILRRETVGQALAIQ